MTCKFSGSQQLALARLQTWLGQQVMSAQSPQPQLRRNSIWTSSCELINKGEDGCLADWPEFFTRPGGLEDLLVQRTASSDSGLRRVWPCLMRNLAPHSGWPWCLWSGMLLTGRGHSFPNHLKENSDLRQIAVSLLVDTAPRQRIHTGISLTSTTPGYYVAHRRPPRYCLTDGLDYG